MKKSRFLKIYLPCRICIINRAECKLLKFLTFRTYSNFTENSVEPEGTEGPIIDIVDVDALPPVDTPINSEHAVAKDVELPRSSGSASDGNRRHDKLKVNERCYYYYCYLN